MIPRTLLAAAAVAAAMLAACAGSVPTPAQDHEPMPASAAAPISSSGAVSPGSRVAVGGPERIEPRTMARPPQPALAVSYRAELVADRCVDRDVPAPPASDVALTVLDRTYALPADHAPDDLVPAAEAGLAGASGTKLVRAVLIEDLAAMREAWEAAGLVIAIDSAYRSYTAQATTFDAWVARIGLEAATLRTARPGHSEHQLGTAIDVSSPGWSGRFGDWARETAEGAWMAEHAWEYGFVMSYPRGTEDETCFGYEPWHYRWIGREAAAEHRASGLVLRDYLERFTGG